MNKPKLTERTDFFTSAQKLKINQQVVYNGAGSFVFTRLEPVHLNKNEVWVNLKTPNGAKNGKIKVDKRTPVFNVVKQPDIQPDMQQNITKQSNLNKFGKIIKGCILEVQNEKKIEKKKFLCKRSDEICKKIKEIGKKEFGM